MCASTRPPRLTAQDDYKAAALKVRTCLPVSQSTALNKIRACFYSTARVKKASGQEASERSERDPSLTLFAQEDFVTCEKRILLVAFSQKTDRMIVLPHE